jgi:hypothetical protein
MRNSVRETTGYIPLVHIFHALPTKATRGELPENGKGRAIADPASMKRSSTIRLHYFIILPIVNMGTTTT